MPCKNKNKLVRGFGINDTNHPTSVMVDGKRIRCPYYQTWWLMLDRCYSKQLHKTHPSYIGCSVCEEWRHFSKFRSWMEKQDWQGNQLDKDILLQGNKVYSPETCVFVERGVNMFMVDREDKNRLLPQGVKLTADNTYSVQVKWKGKTVHVGTYKCVEQAALAYRQKKCNLAQELAHSQKDTRVRDAILRKFPENNGGGHWTEVVESALNNGS